MSRASPELEPNLGSALQGSETLDHWRVNLTFDPVPFEDPELGVKVQA